MLSRLRQFMGSGRQTKYFILTILLYMIALAWTTVQAYARLEYSRTDVSTYQKEHNT